MTTFRDHARYLAEHEDEGLPDYVLWFNPWPDHFAHYAGPYSDAIIGYEGEYDRLDFYLGKMIEIYESVKSAAGTDSYADRTLMGIVSDHGLIYTPKLVSLDEVLFGRMKRDGIQVDYKKLSSDEGAMPLIHGRAGFTPTLPLDAVVGSTAGGSYVIDVLGTTGNDAATDAAAATGDAASWGRHPGFHDLRRHRLQSGATIDWIEQLKTRLEGVLDVAVVREYGPAPGTTWPAGVESVVRIFTPERGEARIHRIHRPEESDTASAAAGETRYRYEILGERDPLDLLGSIRDHFLPPGVTVAETRDALTRCMNTPGGSSEGEWIELLSRTVRPDVIHQFSHLYDTDRAGTINIFPLRHIGMNSSVPGRHAGESFGEKNTTQLYFGAELQKARIQTARNGSLPVTLYHWFVGDEVFHSPETRLGGVEVSPAGQFGFSTLLDRSAFRPIVQKR